MSFNHGLYISIINKSYEIVNIPQKAGERLLLLVSYKCDILNISCFILNDQLYLLQSNLLSYSASLGFWFKLTIKKLSQKVINETKNNSVYYLITNQQLYFRAFYRQL